MKITHKPHNFFKKKILVEALKILFVIHVDSFILSLIVQKLFYYFT